MGRDRKLVGAPVYASEWLRDFDRSPRALEESIEIVRHDNGVTKPRPAFFEECSSRRDGQINVVAPS